MGFVSNNLANGRAFRILMTMRPIGARVRVGRSRSVHEGMGVVRALEKAKAERDSLPKNIMVDDGNEFFDHALAARAMGHGVQMCFIRPGREVKNAFIESFDGRLRDEYLRVDWFAALGCP